MAYKFTDSLTGFIVKNDLGESKGNTGLIKSMVFPIMVPSIKGEKPDSRAMPFPYEPERHTGDEGINYGSGHGCEKGTHLKTYSQFSREDKGYIFSTYRDIAWKATGSHDIGDFRYSPPWLYQRYAGTTYGVITFTGAQYTLERKVAEFTFVDYFTVGQLAQIKEYKVLPLTD